MTMELTFTPKAKNQRIRLFTLFNHQVTSIRILVTITRTHDTKSYEFGVPIYHLKFIVLCLVVLGTEGPTTTVVDRHTETLSTNEKTWSVSRTSSTFKKGGDH